MNKGGLPIRNRSIVFILICTVFFILYLFFCFPLLNKTISICENHDGHVYRRDPDGLETGSRTEGQEQNIFEPDEIVLSFDAPIEPQISDYVLIKMRATSTGDAPLPSASIAVNLGEEIIDDNTVYKIQERMEFYIDGLSHTYYIPVGENKYHMYEWGLSQNRLKERIDKIVIEVPAIEGVDIGIEKIEMKKRDLFALDSHINYYLKNNFNILQINRYMTPVYVFLILLLIYYLVFIMVFSRKTGRSDSGTMPIRGTPKTGRRNSLYLIPVVLVVVFLLAGSSFYFIGNYLFSVKSFWSSYRQHIVPGDPKDTYKGFYDFEDYIFWLGERIPVNENLIVLIRGEPVYMMAEMAYNLYPRDLKFIDITGKNRDQVIDEIKAINSESRGRYSFVNVLTQEDFLDSENLVFIDSYSDTGGFLFEFNN